MIVCSAYLSTEIPLRWNISASRVFCFRYWPCLKPFVKHMSTDFSGSTHSHKACDGVLHRSCCYFCLPVFYGAGLSVLACDWLFSSAGEDLLSLFVPFMNFHMRYTACCLAQISLSVPVQSKPRFLCSASPCRESVITSSAKQEYISPQMGEPLREKQPEKARKCLCLNEWHHYLKSVTKLYFCWAFGVDCAIAEVRETKLFWLFATIKDLGVIFTIASPVLCLISNWDNCILPPWIFVLEFSWID